MMLQMRIHGIKTCFYGIEINPIKRKNSMFMWKLNSFVVDFIGTRNRQTAELLLNCGCASQKVLESSDVTFSLDDLCENHNHAATSDKIMLWCPNNLFRATEMQRLETRRRYDLICKQLAELCDSYPEYNHLFLPFHPGFDVQYINDIVSNIKVSTYKICNTANMDPIEIRHIFESAAVCVCGRFHSVVFSLFYGKPFFAISYSPKTSSILKELGMTSRYVEYGIRESNFFYKEFDLDMNDAKRKLNLVINSFFP